ncbi:efflux RND transporter permease subunit [Myxococcota bacterium]|nr:efflux RND transporter permease subunit [Myxococcota bacterium]
MTTDNHGHDHRPGLVERIIEYCATNRALVLLGVAFATAGAIWSIKHIELDAVPDLSDPQVIIFADWMGRSPTLVEDQVTYPIVSSLVAAPKVEDVRGFSMFGMSFIYVIFEEGTDLYWARSRVLEYLSTIRTRLPAGVNPVLGPDATGIGWVFQYALVDKSGTHSIDELRAFQDFTLRYALGSVPGVAEVASVGGYEKQYQVTIDPNRLRAYGVTLEEVIGAIRDSNNDVGGRILELSGREYYVRGRGYIEDIQDIESVAIRATGASGTPILVRDVGTVRFGPDIRRGLMEWNGEGETVGGIVVMRHGENALDVIERVRARLEDLKTTFPEGVTAEIAYDRSELIERSIDTLKTALVEEAIVVSLVIILFLLHVRSSLLPILSLPVAVSLAFIPMYFFHIPSTIMSLGGIAIAIGATVDAEIVMIEASHKKLENAPPGADRHKLLAEAAREVTPAIFFSLLIIAVSFLPVFSLTGQAGRLFTPLAYTKTFVMLFAAILSITFAPALRDLLIRGKIHPEHSHPVSKAIIKLYKPFVYVALRNPKSTIAVGLFAVMSAIPLSLKLGHEFMPPLNEGDILYMPVTFPNISIEEAKRQIQLQDRVLKSFPEVKTVFGKVGRAETATDPAPITMLETTVQLHPVEKWRRVDVHRWYSDWAPEWLKPLFRPLWPDRRPITWEELTTEMDERMQFPGWTNAWTMPIKGRVDMLSTGVRTPIGVKILGTNLEQIEQIGGQLERVIATIPGTRSVLYERNLGGLYLDIIPDREALARYGLRTGDVERVIEAAIGGAPITWTIEGRNRFSVNVRYPRDLREDIEELKRVLVPVGGRKGGGGGGMGGMGGMGEQGMVVPDEAPFRLGTRPSESAGQAPLGDGLAARFARGVILAQSMPGMNMGGATTAPGSKRGGLSEGRRMTDVPTMDMGGAPSMGRAQGPLGGTPRGSGAGDTSDASTGQQFVPLGQLAKIVIAEGPPMVRNEDGLLVGYVYVDMDTSKRDIGGYVDEAKEMVKGAIERGELTMPAGYFLKWTGQYELLEEMAARMKIVIPLTLMIVILLLYVHFKSFVEVLIVLLSIPFALVGSVWLLWLLDYRMSTAVWVGIIALVGLAAQTGIVMIVYIDNAYERRRKAGKVRDLSDIIWAHMEGTVLRVRPKLMTVTTMLVGLLPLLWATGSGADVMKRIAAPMVGGLITSAFLTLEIIPVIYTYWRQEQLLWERLAGLDPRRLAKLRSAAAVIWSGLGLAVAILVALVYVDVGVRATVIALATAGVITLGGAVVYGALRPAAKAQVWPEVKAA